MILGIDVGGTTIKIGVVDENGQILKVEKFSTPEYTGSPQQFIQLIKTTVHSVNTTYPIKGIGIGLPGQLSLDRKTIIELTNIPTLNGLNLYEPLKNAFPELKIALENDARCAAMGELHFGKHGEKSFLLITLGTGVGGGLIIDGKLFKGANGNATEVGMIPVGLGPYLEDYIGNKHIVDFTLEILKDYPSSALKEHKDLSVADIYHAAKAGDACALAVFSFAGNLLGEAMLSMIHLYDISTIIIGGGVGASFDVLEPSIKEILNERLSPYYLKNFKLLQASLSNESGIVGAASLVV